MKRILLLGAGLSSTVLIEYLSTLCKKKMWQLVIADNRPNILSSTIRNNQHTTVEYLEITDEEPREKLIAGSDIVISMVPAQYHEIVAESCLGSGRSMLTASYITDQLRGMDREFTNAGLLLLGEMGLDPVAKFFSFLFG